MKNKKGFTLIELLVVIAIIGLLSTLAVVSLNTARAKARDARRMSDLKQMSTAFELYYTERTGYPTYPGANTCGEDGVITAVADVVGTEVMCCGAGNSITDGTNVYLNALPCEPGETTGYAYEGNGTDGSGTSYCLATPLEADSNYTFFVCSSGSCFGQNATCGIVP